MENSGLIGQTPLFKGLPSVAIRELAQACVRKQIKKGHELFSTGDKADYFYLIIDGWIKLYRMSRDGEEAVIHVFGPNETFAEAAVFNERRAYPVNAQAVDSASLLAIPRSYFVEKIHSDSTFALRILAAISSRQHYLVQQLEQVTARSAPQRIGTFLLRISRSTPEAAQTRITLPYDKALIAARLGIKPETFSRSLAKLKQHGVSVNGRDTCIHDPIMLAQFCDYDWQEKPC